MRTLVSGGGTGGHVYPILAVVSALRQMSAPSVAASARIPDQPAATTPPSLPAQPGQRPEKTPAGPEQTVPASDAEPVEIRYIGEAGGIEEAQAQRSGIPFSAVQTGQIRGRAPWIVARNLARMVRGVQQCSEVIRQFKPDVAFITGGYVAAPVAWAAWRARPRVPLLIYLPDLTPGQAIRVTSRVAAKVAVSFPEVARYFPGKAVVTGYPVRPELLAADRLASRVALGLVSDLPVLLVFGGSRGARSINRALIHALPQLLPLCQVVHISGPSDWPWVNEQLSAIGQPPSADRYHAYPYLHDEMTQALAAADLVIARAGASVLGEFPAAGLPSILTPYPYAGQHQDANAAYLADRGAALVISDGDLADRLAPAVIALLTAPERLAGMSAAARSLAHPAAAEAIARELRQLVS